MAQGWRGTAVLIAAPAAAVLMVLVMPLASAETGSSDNGSGSTPSSSDTYPVPSASNTAPAPAPAPAGPTRLTVTIANSTVAGHNGQFTLTCDPTGGTHPDPVNGCAKLDQFAASGADPFAPLPANQACSMLYGGPATARVTGVWRGRTIDTSFNRANGCQTSRWNNLIPVLSPESAT
jgi:Subtilisin inhibitor-like